MNIINIMFNFFFKEILSIIFFIVRSSFSLHEIYFIMSNIVIDSVTHIYDNYSNPNF